MGKKEKIVYIATYAGEDPERATLPFMLATGAQTMEVETVIVLLGKSCYLAKKGYAEHVSAPGLKPLKEFMDIFFEMGGRLLVCQAAVNELKIAEQDLIDGIELTGAGKTTEEILSANATLVF